MPSKEIIKHIKKHELILQIGCGAGLLAKEFIKAGYKEYIGFDSRDKNLRKCNKIKKTFKAWGFCFFQSDYLSEIAFGGTHDIVVITDFLEYQKDDLKILDNIQSKAKILITLNSKKQKGMIRAFKNKQEIIERYLKYIKIKSIKYYKSYYIIMAEKI